MTTVEEIKAADLAVEPVLDMTQFAMVKSIPNLMAEIEQVVNDRLTELQHLRSQPELTTEMLNMFGDSAHGLKSGICMIGCKRLALLCYKLEVYGKHGPNQNGQMLFGLYDSYMNPVLQETMLHLQAALAAG